MSLRAIFDKFGNTKSIPGDYDYIPIYERIFEQWRSQRFVLLELGIGGYEGTQCGGNSLMSWREFFPHATIVGIDIYDKSFFDGDRVLTFKCSQGDEEHLGKIIDSVGRPSIIIDDASHHSDLTIKSFQILFPELATGGIYVVEDMHCSYYDRISSTGEDFNGGTHPNTSMNYFKGLTDTLNWEEASRLLPVQNQGITSMEFHKSLIVINK